MELFLFLHFNLLKSDLPNGIVVLGHNKNTDIPTQQKTEHQGSP